MAYVITDACIDTKDQSCVQECPVDCIYVDEDWTPTDDAMWNHIGLTAEETP